VKISQGDLAVATVPVAGPTVAGTNKTDTKS